MNNYIVVSFIVFVLLSTTALATPWIESCSVSLHPNHTASCGRYNISSVQFSAPVKAHIFNGNLSMDTKVLPSVMFKLNDTLIILSTESPTYISSDQLLQITSSDFTPSDSMLWEYSQYNPQAIVHFYVRDMPNIGITITSEFPSYQVRKNTNIVWNVTVSNNGNVTIDHVVINLPHGSNQINSFPTTFTISTEIPFLSNATSYSVNLTGYYDAVIVTNAVRYYLYSNASVILETPQNTPINNSVFLYKTIQPRIYTENNSVTLSLANPSEYYLTDITITDRFKSTGINHTWHFDSLNSSESKTVSYIVVPSQVGSFISPSGYASFYINGAQYNVTSAFVSVTVVSMNNKVNVSSDEVYVSPTPITTPVPIINVTAQSTTPISQTSHPTTVQTPQPQVIVTPTFRIPGFEIIFGIIGVVGIARRLRHG